ncbi:hypothetical protein JQ633_24800 [Bradyrhizobium tropiciagri]|uniref:hypothetical protein n=1 Tax=Bradyrhizobium tropiciagri TaxID=312253 RepID=UPI001BA5EE19|nr:hypothetical protein [Bradyrhizobium tropiciagri]MBR0873599.1 hypothetical protein [Bradyrhizobium tropiciagri]
MKPIVILAMIAAICVTTAEAAPPTVVPSPGYDARLQEQRAAMSARSSGQMAPVTRPVKPHHKKRYPRH